MSNVNYGKLVTLVSAITALPETDVITLGFYVIGNKEDLCAKVVKALESDKTAEECFKVVFADAPVKPEYETVMKNLEEGLFNLLEKLACLVDNWFGTKIADDFRKAVAEEYGELKKIGNKTEWSAKKAKVVTNAKANVAQLKAFLGLDILPAKPSVAAMSSEERKAKLREKLKVQKRSHNTTPSQFKENQFATMESGKIQLKAPVQDTPKWSWQ